MDYMTEAHRLVQRHKAEKQKMNDEEKLKVIRHFRSPVDGNDWGCDFSRYVALSESKCAPKSLILNSVISSCFCPY